MGAVDTTYTFTATDTITSAKMNNIIDQTTITTDAIIGTTLDVASGKLKIRSAGITSNEMGANSVVTAAITDSNVTTAKIADANVTQAKLAPNVVGNGPAFRAWDSATTSLTGGVSTKIELNTEEFDTNNNFTSSRFTPSISGYYIITASVTALASQQVVAIIYKNGTEEAWGSLGGVRSTVSAIVYMNGSSDYIEFYTLSNLTATTEGIRNRTFMSGCLIRSA
jgi:hypothetical protein